MMRLLVLFAALFTTAAVGIFDPSREAGIDPRPGGQIPLNPPFRDENGNATTIHSLADGKPILLAPVLHACPNICGVTLQGLAHAIAGQRFRPGRDFVFIAFGIDPAEDAADARASLARLAAAVPSLPREAIHGLTGGQKEISAVTAALGYRYGQDGDSGQIAHLAASAVLTPDGHLVRWLYGIAPASRDLEVALADAGRGQTDSWAEQILLLCFHYDPQAGAYSSLAWTSLRLGLSVILLLGGGFVAWSIARERAKPRLRP